jgi:HSP20 family protein
MSESSKEKQQKKKENEPITLHTSSEVEKDLNRALTRLRRDFEDFFDISQSPDQIIKPWKSEVPSIDLEDRGADFLVSVDLPGFKKEEVTVDVANDHLTIQASKNQEMTKEDKQHNYIRRERASESFYRLVDLSVEVLSDQSNASLSNGVLQIVLPKKQSAETNAI